ncbi:hypothetical protein LXL04_006590 [Taraxacum kok-saghyz]
MVACYKKTTTGMSVGDSCFTILQRLEKALLRAFSGHTSSIIRLTITTNETNSKTCMEQRDVHAHACMDIEASWNDSMGAKTDYDQLAPSGIEDRMVGEQVG